MSLKHFHVVFLAIAILADAAFWAWTHFMPREAADAGALPFGPYAGWLCIILTAYSAYYMVRKMRSIIV
jgi:hypothetical protein